MYKAFQNKLQKAFEESTKPPSNKRKMQMTTAFSRYYQFGVGFCGICLVSSMVIITVWILTNFLAGDADDMAVANARTGISARGGVGGACFAPGNKVYKRSEDNPIMAKWVNIEDVRKGDFVATDAKNGSWAWTQVFYQRIYPGPHAVSHFDHSNSRSVRVTEDHLVSSQGKLVHARNLLTADPEAAATEKTYLQKISAYCPTDGNWVGQQTDAPAKVRFPILNLLSFICHFQSLKMKRAQIVFLILREVICAYYVRQVVFVFLILSMWNEFVNY